MCESNLRQGQVETFNNIADSFRRARDEWATIAEQPYPVRGLLIGRHCLIQRVHYPQ